MSKRHPKLYLEDIITSISNIEEYTEGLSFKGFSNDKKTIDAVVRNLEIIGEAAKNIDRGFTEKHSELPWSEMISMRNKVIHEYIAVDVEILWKTIKEDLANLKKQIMNINA
jgi:uncharacterized protein with HEPN domain